MKATHDLAAPLDNCPIWAGRPGAYQNEAAKALFVAERTVQAWHWILSTCGEPLCLNPEHLIVNSPVRLAYPSYVCVYCGDPGFTRDHLVPTAWTGEAAREFVITVPACGQCNSLIGTSMEPSIQGRRRVARIGIRRRNRAVVGCRDWTDAELREFGPSMRAHILGRMAEKAVVMQRLSWPEDPAYDLRAIQKSGIPDPYAIGLLEEAA